MPMHNPPHPGETLREDILPALGMSIAAFARHIGISREALSRVLHGHAAISIDLALRLEQAGISSAKVWIGIQADHDLWHARRQPRPHIQKLAVA